MQAASCAVYAGIRIPKRRICESVHGSVRNAVHTMTGMSMLQSISGMRVCVLCTACSDRNIEKTVGHTGIARLCLTQWCHRTRTDGSLFAKGSPRLCRRGRMSVRPARTLFLKVKVLSAPEAHSQQGKGVHREMESEGSLRQTIGPTDRNHV